MTISRDPDFSLTYNHRHTVRADKHTMALAVFNTNPVMARKNLDGTPAIVIFTPLAGILCTPIPYYGDRDPLRELTKPRVTDLDILRDRLADTLQRYNHLFAGALCSLFLPSGKNSKAVRDNNVRIMSLVREGLKMSSITMSFYNHVPRPAKVTDDWAYGHGVMIDGQNVGSNKYPSVSFNGFLYDAETLTRVPRQVEPLPPTIKQEVPLELWPGSIARAERQRNKTQAVESPPRERGRSSPERQSSTEPARRDSPSKSPAEPARKPQDKEEIQKERKSRDRSDSPRSRESKRPEKFFRNANMERMEEICNRDRERRYQDQAANAQDRSYRKALSTDREQRGRSMSPARSTESRVRERERERERSC